MEWRSSLTLLLHPFRKIFVPPWASPEAHACRSRSNHGITATPPQVSHDQNNASICHYRTQHLASYWLSWVGRRLTWPFSSTWHYNMLPGGRQYSSVWSYAYSSWQSCPEWSYCVLREYIRCPWNDDRFARHWPKCNEMGKVRARNCLRYPSSNATGPPTCTATPCA